MTAWVSLTRKFDYRIPGKRAMKAFHPGDVFMTDAEADEAERQGAGKRIEKPDGKKVTKAGQTVDAD
jgi:hypothetical protein